MSIVTAPKFYKSAPVPLMWHMWTKQRQKRYITLLSRMERSHVVVVKTAQVGANGEIEQFNLQSWETEQVELPF
jgi:hypothetical protein